MSKQKKVAVITGASRGIGRAVAEGLLVDGYVVCSLSRSVKSLPAIADEVAYECDVTNPHQVNEVVAQIIKQFGQIDVLFNNAGILRDGTLESVKDFNDMIQVNLIGAFNVLHAVVPHMKKRQQGYIFNVASICGKIGYAGIGAYTASKFGLVGLSESLFNELAAHHVKVTAICPSYVATDMVADIEHPPANLMIQPNDILQIVRSLLSLSTQACVREIVVNCQAII